MRMTTFCPRCHAEAAAIRGKSHDTAAALGGIAGAIQGASSAASRGELCVLGASLGAIANVVVGGLLGGAAGCAAGSVIGDAIDRTLPGNFRCPACGHAFGMSLD
jgi:hypothetical protein